MRSIDLHTHSTASDGTLTPAALAAAAADMGLAAVALTDHDTTSGLAEFLSTAVPVSTELVPGVEVAADWAGKEIHILGLFISNTCAALDALLREIRDNRTLRNNLIIQKLNAQGYTVTLEEVEAVSQGECMGRPHIARILVQKGYFPSTKEVFDTCLARGGGCYVQRVLPPPRQVLELIHQAGGLAFWAHPLHRDKSVPTDFEQTFGNFVALGLDGVEAYFSESSGPQQEHLLKLAARKNILVSGGSDFHGTNQPGVQLAIGRGALNVPESIFQSIKARRANPASKLIHTTTF